MCCAFAVCCWHLKDAWLWFSTNVKLQKQPTGVWREGGQTSWACLRPRALTGFPGHNSSLGTYITPLRASPILASLPQLLTQISDTLSSDLNYFKKTVPFVTQHGLLGKHGGRCKQTLVSGQHCPHAQISLSLSFLSAKWKWEYWSYMVGAIHDATQDSPLLGIPTLYIFPGNTIYPLRIRGTMRQGMWVASKD